MDTSLDLEKTYDPNPILLNAERKNLAYSLRDIVRQSLNKKTISGEPLDNLHNLLMIGLLAPKVSLKTWADKHDEFGTNIRINPQVAALVKNFTSKNGHSIKSAINQLVLSGLAIEGLIPPNEVVYMPRGPISELGLEQVKALRDEAFNRLYVKKSKATRGRPKGHGKQYTFSLPLKVVAWLNEFHGQCGQLVERVMYNLLLSDVEFADLRPILPPFEDVKKKMVIMHLQPWQEELLQRDMAHMGGNVSLSFLRLLETAKIAYEK